MNDEQYALMVGELAIVYGVDEVLRITGQERCEIGGDFWGFLNVYQAAAQVASKKMKIIDFGCYLAFQAAMFVDFAEYIGVDVESTMERFATHNTTHYVSSIQRFIEEHPEMTGGKYFAICSYVPDEEARRLVRETYENCLVYYPTC